MNGHVVQFVKYMRVFVILEMQLRLGLVLGLELRLGRTGMVIRTVYTAYFIYFCI